MPTRQQSAGQHPVLQFSSLAIGMVILLFGGSTLMAQVGGFGDLSPYFSFEYGDGGLPAGIASTTGQQTSPDGKTIQLFGNCGPISGAEFGFGFTFNSYGGFQGPINPGDTFTVGLNFDVQTTGGTVAWDLYADLWSNEGFEDARITTASIPMPPSGQVSGLQFTSSAFSNPGLTGIYSAYVHFDWSGYSPTDTLTISIPQGSIDTTYMSVPEPGAAPLALTACVLLAVWRVRRLSLFHERVSS